MLKSTHYKLRDLEKNTLLDTFHIKRLGLTFASTPEGTGNTQEQLNKALQGTNSTNSRTDTSFNIKPIQERDGTTSVQIY